MLASWVQYNVLNVQTRHRLNVIQDLSDYESDGPTAVSLPLVRPQLVARDYLSCQLQMSYSCMKGSALHPPLPGV